MMRMKKLWFTVVLVLLVAETAPVAELTMKKALTLEVAKQVAAASGQFARKNQWAVVIAIVDDGGHLVYFERMDGVQTGSVQVAIRKAQTAAAFKRPTRPLLLLQFTEISDQSCRLIAASARARRTFNQGPFGTCLIFG